MRSKHPGGVHVAMADASVQFINDDIETSGCYGPCCSAWDLMITSGDDGGRRRLAERLSARSELLRYSVVARDLKQLVKPMNFFLDASDDSRRPQAMVPRCLPSELDWRIVAQLPAAIRGPAMYNVSGKVLCIRTVRCRKVASPSCDCNRRRKHRRNPQRCERRDWP